MTLPPEIHALLHPPLFPRPPLGGPGIPAYNSNNVGRGFNAPENEFLRLQQDALNSPNFASTT